MGAPLACWRCNQPGHPWTECRRPPAASPAELDQRITDITIRWDAGNGFRLSVKTRIIEIETSSYRKEKARKAA